ncbi:MAG TPA: ribosome biogenesis GTPase Der [Acidimicrobiales bacterium]|jgi:GTP-binding protein|nr:ribosome biogenesis GTPase Der [Acidimicrobiales bacterium]
MKKPQVVVVGRPNVGKSSLVNRLAGKRIAVVEEQRGVTRDRKAVDVEWRGVAFEVVDTGGWLESGNTLEDKVSQQAEAALASADLVLLVVDAATGPVEEDSKAARWVRKSGRPVLLVVNKVDDQHHEAASWEFLSLGAGEPVMVSAQHGRGAGDLLDTIVDHLGASTEEPEVSEEDDGALRVAIVGRPNVGKSTLFNQLIGEERSVVHDMPGTTRDAIDTLVDTSAGLIRFIDTAGMRKRARTEAGLETYSVLRSLDALDRADIAILVIDATDGATGQDQRLAERISASGCPALVVLNKWELVATEDRDAVLAGVGEKLAFLGDAPVLKTTALSGKGVHRLLPALSNAAIDYAKRVPTGALNRAIRDLQIKQPAPTGKIRYAVQGATEPPTFTLFVAGKLPSTYLRYVERSLRERFELGASPIRVRVRVE